MASKYPDSVDEMENELADLRIQMNMLEEENRQLKIQKGRELLEQYKSSTPATRRAAKSKFNTTMTPATPSSTGQKFWRHRDDKEVAFRQPSDFDEQRATTTRMKKEVTPDHFNGTNWSRYKIHFQQCVRINKWSQEDALEELAAALRGDALTTLSLFPEGTLTYEALLDELDKIFGPGDEEQVYAMRLKARIRKPDESIQQLGQAIKELASLAYPTMPLQYRDMLSQEAFTDAVNDTNLRQAIFRDKASTLDEAIRAAQAWESYQQIEKNRKQTKPVRALTVEEQTVPKTDIASIEATLSTLASAVKELQSELSKKQQRKRPRDRDMTKVKCFNCDRMGHFYRNCTEPLKPNLSGNGKPPAK